MVKNPPASAGDVRDLGLIPGSEKPPGGGNGNILQYSCLGNPMDRGAWQVAVHGVNKELDSTEHCSLLQFVIFKPSVDIYGLKCSKTNNEQSEKKITETIPFKIASNR